MASGLLYYIDHLRVLYMRRAWNGDRTIGNYPTTSEPEIAYQSFHCWKKLSWILGGRIEEL
jgi:hypothetical protein